MAISWNERFARRTHRMTSSAIREILKVTERPGVISFAGGMPAPEVFPVAEVAAVSQRVLQEAGSVALQYSATEGYRPLRELIARNMSGNGLELAAENVLITTGSQQGIDLIGKIFIGRDDVIAVESPTYLATLQSWRAYEAGFAGVLSDGDGMHPEALEQVLQRDPKLVYCLPTFQNPRGVTLSLPRRRQIVELAAGYGVPLVEDEPYRDLRFEGELLPSLIELEAARSSAGTPYGGNVISLGTVSKILAPGLRVGWVIAAPEVIAQMVLAKQGTDLHTSTFDQMIAYEMLRSGFVERRLDLIINTYRERRDVMLEELEAHFPAGTRWTEPEGGMFLWVELPEGLDAAQLLPLATERQVAFVPGQPFHVDGSGANTMRLNFSNSPPEKIRTGIRRLAEALEEFMERERIPRLVAHSAV